MRNISIVSTPIGKVTGEVYSLQYIEGVRLLSALDTKCHYESNYQQGKVIFDSCKHLFDDANTKLKKIIPDIHNLCIQRLCYFDLIIPLIQFADIFRRVSNLLYCSEYTKLHYYGVHDWKSELIKAICKSNNVDFYCHTPIRLRLKELFLPTYRRLQETGNRYNSKNNLNQNCDILYFANAARFSLGLPEVFNNLNQTVQVVDSMLNPCLSVFPKTVHLECFESGSQKISEIIYSILIKNITSCSVIYSDIDCAASLRHLITEVVKNTIPRIVSISRLIDSCPSAQVVGANNSEEFLEVARQKGRKVTVIQTCGIYEYRIHVHGHSQYLVASDADEEYLLKLGVDPQSIQIVGYPYYQQPDVMRIEINRQEIRKKYFVPNSEPLVLFAGSYGVSGFIEWGYIEELSKRFYNAFSKLAGGIAIVKLHPYDNHQARHLVWAAECGVGIDRLHIVQDTSIQPFLQACDLLVMIQSTVGQEAILLDKPIIDMPFTEDLYGYHSTGAVLEAKDDDAMAVLLGNILSDEDMLNQLSIGRETFRAQYLHMQDGHACERIADALSETVDSWQ